MAPPQSDEVGEKLPDTVWLQHKDILHRLYIADNKSLSVVKRTMEDEHGFQPQRLCDYEVALRDVLHFRKNLKREEWRAIAIHISERKRRAKESEVIWNNTPFEAKKLRKELQRNSQPKSGRKVNPGLPQGLVIRTPPRSPATYAAVPLPPPEPQLEVEPAYSPQDIGGGSNYPVNPSSAAEESISEVQQALFDAGEFSVSPYHQLRGNLPFNRCMSRIVDLAQTHQLRFCIPSAEAWTSVSPRLFGANPSWELFGGQIYRFSNERYTFHSDSLWFLKWVAISADFALLKAFFSIDSPTAGAVYECFLKNAERLRMTDLVRVLFALRPALGLNNPTSVSNTEFIRVAVELGSRSGVGLDILNTCLSNKPPLLLTKSSAFRKWAGFSILTAAERGDIAMLRMLVDADWKVEPHYRARDKKLIGRLLSRIYNCDIWKENAFTAYIELLLRGGVLDVTASSQCSDDDRPHVITDVSSIGSIAWDELVMICPPIMRKTLLMTLTRLGQDQGTGVNRAGVFTFAQGGTSGLRAYLEAHQEDDPFLVRVTLEECLLFAAVLNDSKTALALLQFGVDPHVGLLSNNLEWYEKGNLPWNPSIVAAAAGNLEVLSLLLSRIDLLSFLHTAPIHELVRYEKLRRNKRDDFVAKELCRLGNLHRSYLLAETRSAKLATDRKWRARELWDARISIGRNLETLEYIRSVAHCQGYGQTLDLEIIKAAMCCRHMPWLPRFKSYLPCNVLLMKGLIDAHLEYEEGGMDLLHLSIRNHCSFTVVRFLTDNSFEVHSKPSGQNGNTMLHDALLSKSPDRSKIVEFLLEEGADCTICGDGLTILEASLWNSSSYLGMANKSEYREIFERLLDHGATSYQRPRERLRTWRPLIEMLLSTQADDDIILRAIDAGAPLNACGYGNRRYAQNLNPLQAAIFHEREGLARELIRRGADVHAPAAPRHGFTVLQMACQYDLPIRFLEYLVVDLGVDVNEPPARIGGYTSLAAAAEEGSLSTVEFLLDHGADINATCMANAIFPGDRNQFCRPLDRAVFDGSLDKVEFLLKAGGRSGKAGLGGAIDIATSSGHYAILSVLRSWNEKHGRRILEEEALWQRQNPGQTLMISELIDSLEYYSESDIEYDSDVEED